jgi:hypothetical protein
VRTTTSGVLGAVVTVLPNASTSESVIADGDTANSQSNPFESACRRTFLASSFGSVFRLTTV